MNTPIDDEKPATSVEANEGGRRLNAALVAHHAALEATLKRFSTELSGGGNAALVLGIWRSIEVDLGAHLRAEERLILPTFERAYPHHGAMVRRHHDQIRQLLERLSVQLTRGELEPSSVDQLIDVLRHHARHEEVVFYYWAKLHMDDTNAQRVVDALRAGSPRGDVKARQGK